MLKIIFFSKSNFSHVYFNRLVFMLKTDIFSSKTVIIFYRKIFLSSCYRYLSPACLEITISVYSLKATTRLQVFLYSINSFTILAFFLSIHVSMQCLTAETRGFQKRDVFILLLLQSQKPTLLTKGEVRVLVKSVSCAMGTSSRRKVTLMFSWSIFQISIATKHEGFSHMHLSFPVQMTSRHC